MIVTMHVMIFAVTCILSILYVVDKKELVWPILAALGWLVLSGLSWSIEYVFAYENAGEVVFEVYEYSGGVFLMWFFFALAIVFAILSYQRAMDIQKEVAVEHGRHS